MVNVKMLEQFIKLAQEIVTLESKKLELENEEAAIKRALENNKAVP